tara:strand:- start:4633 stop:4809 length:177 start_codon:yes stop_codon:yes gene_type:complete
MVEMIRVKVQVGCPSDWSKGTIDSTEVMIREDLVEYFCANIIDYARRSREDDDWEPIE